MKFDLLEIQKIIEEKRLIWGAKLEVFLLKIIRQSIVFVEKIFHQIFFIEKNFSHLFYGFVGLALAIFLSNHKFFEYFLVENFSLNNIFSFDRRFFIIKNYLFPIAFFLLLALPYIKKQLIAKKLFFAAIFAAVIIFFDSTKSCVTLPFFLALTLPLLASVTFLLLKEHKISSVKNWLIILPILLLPQFDPEFSPIILNLCYFWWIILLFEKKNDPCLFLMALINLVLIIFDISGQISWLFSAIILMTLFKKNYSPRLDNANPTQLVIILISLVLAYFISLIIF